MVAPYYDRAGITIYHGDCLDVVDDLAPHIGHQLFDLLLTDPPYGIGTWSATGGNSLPPDEVDQINRWDVAIDPVTLRRMIAVCREAIIWGGNYYGDLLGRTRAPIVWDKAMRGMHFADGEMAWTNFQRGTLRICDLPIARRRYQRTTDPSDTKSRKPSCAGVCCRRRRRGPSSTRSWDRGRRWSRRSA